MRHARTTGFVLLLTIVAIRSLLFLLAWTTDPEALLATPLSMTESSSALANAAQQMQTRLAELSPRASIFEGPGAWIVAIALAIPVALLAGPVLNTRRTQLDFLTDTGNSQVSIGRSTLRLSSRSLATEVRRRTQAIQAQHTNALQRDELVSQRLLAQLAVEETKRVGEIKYRYGAAAATVLLVLFPVSGAVSQTLTKYFASRVLAGTAAWWAIQYAQTILLAVSAGVLVCFWLRHYLIKYRTPEFAAVGTFTLIAAGLPCLASAMTLPPAAMQALSGTAWNPPVPGNGHVSFLLYFVGSRLVIVLAAFAGGLLAWLSTAERRT